MAGTFCSEAGIPQTIAALTKGNQMGWNNPANIGSREYRCGFCDNIVASAAGYYSLERGSIYLCPHCDQPTFFDKSKSQYPGIAPGNDVDDVPAEIEALYGEARRCAAANAPTSAVLACRKLLMHIAVEQGAQQGQSFMKYVEYLADNGYVPPNGKGWVDHIRKKGNEANHEIVLMGDADATELISFAEMLLKFLYEFPARVPTP